MTCHDQWVGITTRFEAQWLSPLAIPEGYPSCVSTHLRDVDPFFADSPRSKVQPSHPRRSPEQLLFENVHLPSLIFEKKTYIAKLPPQNLGFPHQVDEVCGCSTFAVGFETYTGYTFEVLRSAVLQILPSDDRTAGSVRCLPRLVSQTCHTWRRQKGQRPQCPALEI